MKTIYGITQAQAKLPSLLKEVRQGKTIAISVHREPTAFLVPKEKMEAIAETLEIMSNPDAIKAIESHKLNKLDFHPLSALEDA